MLFASIFTILVGLGMIAQWSASYFKNQITELKTEPIRIGFHLAAEMTTAVLLIVAGVGLLTRVGWAMPVFLVAIGMLFYTVIVSPGYFAQKGQWAWLGMFSAILILGVISVVLVL